MTDFWDLFQKGVKVTFWCVGIFEELGEPSRGRTQHDHSTLQESESQKNQRKQGKHVRKMIKSLPLMIM